MIANRYTLEREIGRGGMGSVWLGRDELLGRLVAMKRVGRLPGSDESPESDQLRAEREARIAASLNHPHVVAIFDLVADDDHQWLVMEFVDGRSLAQVVRDQGPLDPDRAGAVLADAAAALAAAHAEGVVHRDVKPSNILLTKAGEAKLLDFGIAKAQGDLTLTQTGLVSGSPAYLSPEVASGRPATTASDVWSLGATLFHLLSGGPPYDIGDNVVGGLYRIVHQEPPTLEHAGWLAPLLASTMVRDPDERWSMHRVATFLEAGPDGTRAMRPVPSGAARTAPPTVAVAAPEHTAAIPAKTAPGRREPPRKALLVLAGVVAALLVAIVAVWALPDEQPDPPAPLAASPLEPTETPDDAESEAPAAEPTEEAMATFVEDYLRTAASDARAGYAQLTPEFQQASNGLSGYRGFWGGVTEIVSVDVQETDVASLRVRYTYTYRRSDGARTTETVALQLAYDEDDDAYLIAGEA